jgi:hypothetical protein
MPTGRCRGVVILVVVLLFSASGARAENVPVEAFFGTYEGVSIQRDDDGTNVRDLGVRIGPTNGGFNVTWTTTVRTTDGKSKPKSYSIDFEESRREDIYRSQMRADKFGNRVPLDPLAGDPYVWARISGPTLTVNALVITDDGDYDLQVYHRTLTEDGLALEFSRFREGEEVRTVTAQLRRVGR